MITQNRNEIAQLLDTQTFLSDNLKSAIQLQPEKLRSLIVENHLNLNDSWIGKIWTVLS